MDEFVFECPHCHEQTIVDAGVKNLLLDDGCIVCGQSVKSRAFRRRPRTN